MKALSALGVLAILAGVVAWLLPAGISGTAGPLCLILGGVGLLTYGAWQKKAQEELDDHFGDAE